MSESEDEYMYSEDEDASMVSEDDDDDYGFDTAADAFAQQRKVRPRYTGADGQQKIYHAHSVVLCSEQIRGIDKNRYSTKAEGGHRECHIHLGHL